MDFCIEEGCLEMYRLLKVTVNDLKSLTDSICTPGAELKNTNPERSKSLCGSDRDFEIF